MQVKMIMRLSHRTSYLTPCFSHLLTGKKVFMFCTGGVRRPVWRGSAQPCSCFILFDCGAAPSVTLASDCDACAAGEVRARECRAAGGRGCDGGGAAARGHTQVNTCLAPLPPPYHHHVQVFGCVCVIAGVLVQGHRPHPLFHPSAPVTLLLPGQELCVRRTYNATYVRRRG